MNLTRITLVNFALILALACPALAATKAPPAKKTTQATTVTLHITGTIEHGSSGYVIRGDKPAEVFTIHNAEAAKLDSLAASGKKVQITARSVVGDNVDIVTVDGKAY